MPAVLDAMIEPIKAQFPALHDVARVRMFEEFTSDEAVLVERLKNADALLVGGYHISDDLLRTISEQPVHPPDAQPLRSRQSPGYYDQRWFYSAASQR